MHFGKRGGEGVEASENRKPEEKPEENMKGGGLDKLNLRDHIRKTGVNLCEIEHICWRLSASARDCANIREFVQICTRLRKSF